MLDPAKKGLRVDDVQVQIIRKISALVQSPGNVETAFPGLTLYRENTPGACYLTSVIPSVSVFLQGTKRITFKGAELVCDRLSFLVSGIDLPIQSQVTEASVELPQIAMRLSLNMTVVREVLSRDDLPELVSPPQRRGLAIGKTTAGLLSVASRMIDLLETPTDIPFLGHLIESEVVYRILQTAQGERLRAIATTGSLPHRAAKAINWLSTNYAKPLRMEDLAEIARMGVSTLHHQFRTLTSLSPLQFQKQLRLQTARHRMMEGLDATSAAYEVGYESVSQFNREYSRMFGLPPMRDVKALRESQATGKVLKPK